MIVNGVTLPDIPAEVLAEYPYAVITHTVIYDMDVYSLAVSSQPFDHGSAELLGQEMLLSHGEGQNFMESDGVWDDLGTTSHSPFGVQLGEITAEGMTMEYTLVWTNQTEFKEIVWIDSDTMEWGTEPKEEKPTRVSIGRSLVDGYAREVQRLTGTAEQMNAIQIREKLATVKAGIKIGDTVLPPIPEDVLAEYPYVVIVRGIENDLYRFMPAAKPFTFLLSGDYEVISDNTTTQRPIYDYDPSINTWVENGTGTGFSLVFNGVKTYELLWSNHDIINQKTNEVYFSERQNFNGVWLPKIPADVLEQYPYKVILKVSARGRTMYMLAGLTEELTFAPKEIAATVVECDGILYTKQPCTITSFMYTGAGNWLEQGVSNNDTFKVHVGMTDISYDVFWCNSDVCIATAYDTATNIATIGTELYFPPLPAIDTDRVSIGYDLCDGIVEEVQRLSGTEDKMNALRAYWKLTTVNAEP